MTRSPTAPPRRRARPRRRRSGSRRRAPSSSRPRPGRARTPRPPPRVVGVGQPRLLGQRAALEPLEQRHAERRRSPAPAGSARGCRRSRAAAARRAGRAPRRRRGRRAKVGEGAARDDHAVATSRRRRPRRAAGPAVNGSPGRVEDACLGRASRVPTPCGCALRRLGRKACSSSAATPSAMVAGSLPVEAGQADRATDPGDRLVAWPSAASSAAGTAPTSPTSRSARCEPRCRSAARRRRGRRPRRGRGS